MNTLTLAETLLAEKSKYDGAGGGVGGIVFVCLILWVLLGGSGPKNKK
jgi:hypothetical protein